MHLVNARDHAVVTSTELPLLRKGRPQLSWNVHDLDDFKMGYAGAILMVTDSEAEAPRGIFAVSRSYLHRRGGGRKYQTLEAYDWSRVAPRIPWDAVRAELRPGMASELDRELDRSVRENAPQELPTVLAAHLHSALYHLSSDIGNLLAIKGRNDGRTGAEDSDAGVLADKVATAIRLSGANYRDALPLEPTDLPPEEAQRLGKMLERNMMSTDATLMPGWDLNRRIDGWFEFNGAEDRRIFVKSVDTEKTESETGGDLIYIRTNPDLAIVVQYKKLMKSGRGGRWLFYDDGRLLRQLADLVSLDRPPNSRVDSNVSEAPTGPEPAAERACTPPRLRYQAGFVKFVDAAPVAGDGVSLLPGCYLPAEYALAALSATAPEKGGLPPFDPRAKSYIDTNVFVTLVSGGWIGAGALVRSRLATEYLPYMSNERTGAVTMAFDVPRAGLAPVHRARRGRTTSTGPVPPLAGDPPLGDALI